MSWPTAQDYNEAVQSPAICFADAELKGASVELNALGLPKCVSGAFASVYRLSTANRHWAVRCFLTDMSDLEERYEKLSKFILQDQIEQTLPFEFIVQGIRVGKRWHPIVRMPWLEGLTIDEYVRRSIDTPERIEQLAEKFWQMYRTLQENGIAHGDLQHGNILVLPDGEIRLVDYDGMFVRGLEGCNSPELGHPSYQHPKRTALHFNAHIDDFSAALIYGSLRTLAADPSLFSRLRACEDKLLFNREDLNLPIFSQTFRVLETHQNDEISTFARHIRKLLAAELSEIQPFDGTFVNDSSLPPLQDPALLYLPNVTMEHSLLVPAPLRTALEQQSAPEQVLAKYVITPRLQILALQAGKYRNTKFRNPQLAAEFDQRLEQMGLHPLGLTLGVLVALLFILLQQYFVVLMIAFFFLYGFNVAARTKSEFAALTKFAEDNEPQNEALKIKHVQYYDDYSVRQDRYTVSIARDFVTPATIINSNNWFGTKFSGSEETTVTLPVFVHPRSGRPIGVFYEDKVYWLIRKGHPIDLRPQR